MPKTKRCTRCGRRRPLDHYLPQEKYARDGRSAGRGAWCRSCRTAAVNEWRDTNQDDFLAKKRAYESRPEVKARRRARDRRRRKEQAA